MGQPNHKRKFQVQVTRPSFKARDEKLCITSVVRGKKWQGKVFAYWKDDKSRANNAVYQ
jgi:hypothetical protein